MPNCKKSCEGCVVMIQDINKANESITENSYEISKLKEILPQCFNKDGAFNMETFKSILKDNVAISDENYELNFLGKSYARLIAALDTDTVIVPDEEHNNKPENKNSNNVYISGDNLDALKHLLKAYEEKIKCIYIDPPYNTGSDGFVYNDKFNFTVDYLVSKLGIDADEASRILNLTKKNNTSHSAWLTFMYPRLLLARDLLTKNGAIFISIDDNEQADLKLLCDSIFGENNFVTSLAWQSRTSVQNDTDISVNHEYILVYAKNRRLVDRRLKEKNAAEWFSLDSFACMPKPLDESRFENPDNDPRGKWKADPFDAPNERANLTYYIENPNTGERYLPPDGRCWRTEEDNYKKLLEDGRILFGQNGTSRPQLKVFYEEKKHLVVFRIHGFLAMSVEQQLLEQKSYKQFLTVKVILILQNQQSY